MIHSHWGGTAALFNSAWIDDSMPGGRAIVNLICKNVKTFASDPAVWEDYIVDEPSKHRTSFWSAESSRHFNRAGRLRGREAV